MTLSVYRKRVFVHQITNLQNPIIITPSYRYPSTTSHWSIPALYVLSIRRGSIHHEIRGQRFAARMALPPQLQPPASLTLPSAKPGGRKFTQSEYRRREYPMIRMRARSPLDTHTPTHICLISAKQSYCIACTRAAAESPRLYCVITLERARRPRRRCLLLRMTWWSTVQLVL